MVTALDTLFVLARAVIDPNDSSTYEPAFEHLSRASDLVNTRSPTNANYVRCVSGAFHHLAGCLYQNDRYGVAIRFLREGCVLGGRALDLKGQRDDSEETPEAVWTALKEQLYRRWELLAVCYLKTGEKKVSLLLFGKEYK